MVPCTNEGVTRSFFLCITCHYSLLEYETLLVNFYSRSLSYYKMFVKFYDLTDSYEILESEPGPLKDCLWDR